MIFRDKERSMRGPTLHAQALSDRRPQVRHENLRFGCGDRSPPHFRVRVRTRPIRNRGVPSS